MMPRADLTRADILRQLERDPFIPLRVLTSKGHKFSVPERHYAYSMPNGIIILLPRLPGKCYHEGYVEVAYNDILDIAPS